ncbi:MAG: hypothetical protein O7F71_18885 [Gammaproteobacteria bacterium]|nr:hypothetical protein [Gammaproteobacteria bacterium]
MSQSRPLTIEQAISKAKKANKQGNNSLALQLYSAEMIEYGCVLMTQRICSSKYQHDLTKQQKFNILTVNGKKTDGSENHPFKNARLQASGLELAAC